MMANLSLIDVLPKIDDVAAALESAEHVGRLAILRAQLCLLAREIDEAQIRLIQPVMSLTQTASGPILPAAD
jgi:hypothetical protein